METSLMFHNNNAVLQQYFKPGKCHTAKQGTMEFAHRIYLANCTVVTRNRFYLALRTHWEKVTELNSVQYYKARVADLPTILVRWHEDGKWQHRVYWQYPDAR